MSATLAPATGAQLVRDAEPADNDSLVQLAAACPMRGDLTMCIDRAPDFFSLVKLEGERWRVGVADVDGTVVGCVAASERLSYVNGAATRTGYVGDLKVHPAHRNGVTADALAEFSRGACHGYGGDDMLTHPGAIATARLGVVQRGVRRPEERLTHVEIAVRLHQDAHRREQRVILPA